MAPTAPQAAAGPGVFHPEVSIIDIYVE